MRCRLLSGFGLICLAIHLSFTAFANAEIQEYVWKYAGSGIRDSDIKTVIVTPDNPDMVYANSAGAVYKSEDRGKYWREILSFMGSGNAINTLFLHPSNPDIVYTGSDKGLYESTDRGTSWKKVFTGVGEMENSVLAIAAPPDSSGPLYLGTRGGLFIRANSSNRWEKEQHFPSGTAVTCIAIDPGDSEFIYVASDKGAYRSLNGGSGWEKIFTPDTDNPADNNSSEEDSDYYYEDDEFQNKNGVRNIVIDPSDSSVLYTHTPDRVYISKDRGVSWEALSTTGLTSRNIRHIMAAPALFAATGKGVFRYTSETWEHLYKGLTSSNINYISAGTYSDTNGTPLWAAAENGVFVTVAPEHSNDYSKRSTTADDISGLFAHEPTIDEIRDIAIRYAEVHPDKIRNWRKAAASRAWLPDLKFSYDKGLDWQSDRYYYSGKYVEDDVTKGRDQGWSVSLTWELGDLIWNGDQTSIDSRSRLVVQLRDDILNEVTRLYFERRRLQYEQVLEPSEDMKAGIEQDLRLQELTAGIDALTGSYLSKRLGQIGM